MTDNNEGYPSKDKQVRNAARPRRDAAPVRISPLYDAVFLKTFGESEASSRGFANAVLRHFGMPELGEVDRIVTDAALPSSVGIKAPRCDVTIVAGDQVVDLEPQMKRVNVDNKALYYGAKQLCANTPKGSDNSYDRLPQVVVIMLLRGFNRFRGERFITRGQMAWDGEDGPVAGSDRVLAVVVEIDKVEERYNGGVTEEVLADELTAWLYMLARGYRDEEEAGEIVEHFSGMEEFAEHYKLAINDPETVRAYDSYLLDVMEYNSVIECAVEEAREQAREQAYGEGIGSLAAEFRALGVSEETVAEAVRRTEAAAAVRASHRDR